VIIWWSEVDWAYPNPAQVDIGLISERLGDVDQ
jgi:hypothetical protein